MAKIIFIATTIAAFVLPLRADEGGVSFWLPGQYGSLAAVPVDAGWSLGLVYYHSDVEAGASKEFARNGQFTAGLEADADILLIAPSYTFKRPVLGGQANVGLAIGTPAQTDVSASATLSGPHGNSVTANPTDSASGVTDLYPSATLKWNNGDHNYLAYTMAGAPTGKYDSGELANLGTKHWAADAGGGYTYFNQNNGREFSAVAGLTYNWENTDTDYQNGVDAHLDWGASQFFSKSMHAGLVGYFYEQIGDDSGAGARLGDFKSRVSAVGAQFGWFFKAFTRNSYANFKWYDEFNAKNRPEGWNMWLTWSIS